MDAKVYDTENELWRKGRGRKFEVLLRSPNFRVIGQETSGGDINTELE